jgi:WD40 repeat protein
LQIPEEGTLGETVSVVRFSPDGSRLVFATLHGVIQVWDITQKVKVSDLVGSESELNFLEWDSTGRGILGGDESGLAWIWNAKTGNARVISGHTGPIRCGTFTADGISLFSFSFYSRVLLSSP